MPSKTKTIYLCTACGQDFPKWFGKCPSCNEWNTVVEDTSILRGSANTKVENRHADKAVSVSDVSIVAESRKSTGMGELDRVFGGGVVSGSVSLIGGEPGIGKSTLLLQVCETLSQSGKVLYFSGEESKNQIKLRADRLSVTSDNIFISSETCVERIIDSIHTEKPKFVIIDSIQTVQSAELNSLPGSLAQIKESAIQIIEVAKSNGISVFLIGHVNKEGSIAGPKILEHMVDVVLYFEGDTNLDFRVLRAAKNRFGSTNEIGIFDMQEKGLMEISNPSVSLLSERPKGVSGTCTCAIMEGTRPILTEVQALITATNFGQPRRTSNGMDYNRFSMIIAVLEKRLGYKLSICDAYFNVIGGLRLSETACDLSVLLAIASSYKDKPISDNLVAIGEIGLAGEIRSVRNCESRVLEAVRLGFNKFILPHNNKNLKLPENIEVKFTKNIAEAITFAIKD